MRTKSILHHLVLAALIVGGIGFTAVVWSPSSKNPPAAAQDDVATSDSRVAWIESRLGALEGDQRSLRRDIAHARHASAEAAQPPTHGSHGALTADRPLTLEERRERADAFARDQARLLEDIVGAEPNDTAWSANAEASLRQRHEVGEVLPESNIDVQCMKTVCRVTAVFPEPALSELGLRELRAARPWRGKSYAQLNPETGRATYYIAREGHDLPAPDRAAP